MINRPRKLASYLKIIDSLNVDDATCYRGQKEAWSLLPKIARVTARYHLIDDEQQMLQSLRQQIPQFVDSRPQNDWDLLAIGQHHGMATRLLDWTYNPLAALWFAVRNPPSNKDACGVVWVCFPEDEDVIGDLESRSPFSHGRSKLFVPNHVSPRIRAQSGLFSVQKPTRSGHFVPFELNKYTSKKLKKIEIEPGYFQHLRYELDVCGLNHASMFPDLDGLCGHLTWKYTRLSDETGA